MQADGPNEESQNKSASKSQSEGMRRGLGVEEARQKVIELIDAPKAHQLNFIKQQQLALAVPNYVDHILS